MTLSAAPAGEGGILVTGATGNVGSEVCRRLVPTGRRVYAAVTPRRAAAAGTNPGLPAAGAHACESRVLDYTLESTWDAALRDVTRIFLVRPPHISNIARDMTPFLRDVSTRDVEQIVFLSVQGAERTPIIPHRRIERTIMELGVPYTFVRPSFFMQNLTTTHLPEIRDESRIFVPAGSGRTNFVDVRDLADVVVRTLGGGEHLNAAYEVTGAASWTYEEVAALLSRRLGRTIVYEPARLLPFVRYQRACGRNSRHALVMYALYSVTRLGLAGDATDTMKRLTGREPRSLPEFVDDHQELLGAARR